MFFGGFLWLFVLGILAFVVTRLLRGARERSSPGLNILEERYARGEINRDEYLQKKHDIVDAAG
jgi:putative membrane protein